MNETPHTPAPTPSDGDRELLRQIISPPAGCPNVTQRAIELIRTARESAVAQAVAGLQAKLAVVMKEEQEKFYFNEKIQSECDSLRVKVKQADALMSEGSEKIEELRRDLTRMTALVVVLKEALGKAISYEFYAGAGSAHLTPLTEALALLPADLSDCCVVKRSEWESAEKNAACWNVLANCADTLRARDFGADIGPLDDRVIAMAKALDDSRTANAALEADNRALRDVTQRHHILAANARQLMNVYAMQGGTNVSQLEKADKMLLEIACGPEPLAPKEGNVI